MKTLVEALRCSASTERKECIECPYRIMEEIEDEIPYLPDLEEDGKQYWITCDCDRMALDAANELERLYKIENRITSLLKAGVKE